MENLTNFKMTKDKVVQSPKDEILEGVIIEVNKTTWANIIPADKLHKFTEVDKHIIQIKYETMFKNNSLKGEETYTYYENPMSNSKLGKYLMKYESLEVGKKIKVLFNKDGYSSIMIE